jgi:2-polyprenyl-3-methyl-5-hydroxy-6-metoxy-1,4-benzoquinol methylase
MANQRHLYDYKVNPHTAAEKIVRMVGVNKRILEIGCGPGSITRLLQNNKCRVTGMELDEKAIEIVSQYCEAVHACDLNDPLWPANLSAADPFEVIVAGDVLEHLYDPWTTLSSLKPLLAKDGYVVVSVPHVGHNAVIACLLLGDFEYQPWGLLDKTHIRFFCINNIQKLFENAGFKIVEVDYVIKTPEQTEFAKRWRQLPDATKEALAINQFGTVFQVVIKAVPKTAEGKALRLVSQPVPLPIASSFSDGAKGSRLLAFFISFLSLRTRQKISHTIQKLGFKP